MPTKLRPGETRSATSTTSTPKVRSASQGTAEWPSERPASGSDGAPARVGAASSVIAARRGWTARGGAEVKLYRSSRTSVVCLGLGWDQRAAGDADALGVDQQAPARRGDRDPENRVAEQ